MAVLVAACALALVPACSSDDDGASTTAATDGDLAALVVTDVPAGYIRQPDDRAEAGPMDLEQASAALGGDPAAARQVLADNGFVAGHARLWLRDGADPLVVRVFQVDETGSEAVAQAAVAALVSAGAEPIGEAEGIPGSTVLAAAASQLPGGGVVFADGPHVVQVVAVAEDDDAGTDLATDVAENQLERLG